MSRRARSLFGRRMEPEIAKDEPKSIKETQRELAELSKQLEDKIRQAESKHPPPSDPARDDSGAPPAGGTFRE
jgi:Sec-independent protein translocase protein TatA